MFQVKITYYTTVHGHGNIYLVHDGGRADGHGEVGIDVHVEAVLLERVLDEVPHGGYPGGPSHHDDLVDVLRPQVHGLERLLDGHAASPELVGACLVEVGPRQREGAHLARAALRRGPAGHDGVRGFGERDLGLLGEGAVQRLLAARQKVLGGLRRALRRLHGLLVGEDVLHAPTEAHVKVGAAEAAVAGGPDDLHGSLVDEEDGHVQRAAAKVVHEDVVHVLLAVEVVGERRRRRLLEHAHDLEPRALEGLAGGAALPRVKIRRHGDDGLVHLRVAEVPGHHLQQVPHDALADLLRGDDPLVPRRAHVEPRLAHIGGLLHHLEGVRRHDLLERRIAPGLADEALRVEDDLLRLFEAQRRGIVAHERAPRLL
mmetsp:Transcript_4745/g.13517  ORF Transcript_4745/g.13517 Transcript_4745/m.13517 type:complete len:372 (+) Transcript_4745:782-1897(+)